MYTSPQKGAWILTGVRNLAATTIIFSFYYEHVLKLPQQKGLLFMQSDWVTELFSICIVRQAEHRAQ